MWSCQPLTFNSTQVVYFFKKNSALWALKLSSCLPGFFLPTPKWLLGRLLPPPGTLLALIGCGEPSWNPLESRVSLEAATNGGKATPVGGGGEVLLTWFLHHLLPPPGTLLALILLTTGANTGRQVGSSGGPGMARSVKHWSCVCFHHDSLECFTRDYSNAFCQVGNMNKINHCYNCYALPQEQFF